MTTSFVTVDLDAAVLDEVDQYATRHGLAREDAVRKLIREALDRPVANRVSGTVGQSVVQTGGDIHGGVNLR